MPLKASTEGLFGIENRLKELHSLLARKPNGVCFVGIWGMGGIGKTTTARVIFNELIDGFEGGCFLQNVCKHGMVDMQKALLSKVLRTRVNIWDENEGSNMIRDRFCSKRVLVVLDDVNNINQLESLAGKSEWFGSGSRIIVTTRDKHLLNDVNEFYKIETLSEDEAIQLFCCHAFRRRSPPENFVQLSNCVVRYACGLPLALKILGSHLCGRQKDVWRSTLDKLKDDPDKSINATLKISFDGLSDTQQDIFLDIACLFRGCFKNDKGWAHSDKVNKKLDSFGFHPVVGISDLIDKSLIHIESEGEIQMHDLIHEMGRNIIRQKANKKPERFSRLWDSEDIIDVLSEGTGTIEIEALVLHEDASDDTIKLNEGTFKNMNRLRLLEVHRRSNLVVAPNYLPNSLRWISWMRCPFISLPGNFQPRRLVNLNLSGSPTLEMFPDISCMPNLEFLNLSECVKLLEVPPFIAVHKKLVNLDLSGCEKLEKFLRIEMESLESLDLSGCVGLQILPEFHINMICLRTFRLNFIRIKEFPCSVGRLTSLQEITMNGCLPLPSSLKRKRAEDDENYDPSRMLTLLLSLPLLRKLEMRKCHIAHIILPEHMGCFTSLQELDLSDNNQVFFPQRMIKLPSSLQALWSGISIITEILKKHKNLHKLFFGGCKKYFDDLVLSDWRFLVEVLCTRQEVLQVLFPPIQFYNYMDHYIGSHATVILSPSLYNDKLRGFVIFSLCKRPRYRVCALDGLVTMIPYNKIHSYSDEKYSVILYIPIDKFATRKDWNDPKYWCLLEVANYEDVESWRIQLVYEGGDFDYSREIEIVNHDVGATKYPTVKVCVAARNQIQ